jgi:hypothetical protein
MAEMYYSGERNIVGITDTFWNSATSYPTSGQSYFDFLVPSNDFPVAIHQNIKPLLAQLYSTLRYGPSYSTSFYPTSSYTSAMRITPWEGYLSEYASDYMDCIMFGDCYAYLKHQEFEYPFWGLYGTYGFSFYGLYGGWDQPSSRFYGSGWNWSSGGLYGFQF